MSQSKASAKKLKAAERRLQAIELRKQGMTYRQIGDVLGCNESRAHQIVTEEMARLNVERAESAALLVRLECERMDALHSTLWPVALAGDLNAVDRVIKLMARRAKLLGLDAPSSTLVNVNRPVPTTIIEEVVGDTAHSDSTASGTETLPR